MTDDRDQDDRAIRAVERLDSESDAEYEAPLADAAGVVIDPGALAVDSRVDGADDDTSSVELTLGQVDDLSGDAPDPR